MALFKFTNAIINNNEIPVFNFGNHRRDFTYIDDICEGILRVLDKPATPDTKWNGNAPEPGSSKYPWRVYNIGNAKPVMLMDYIKAIEKALGKKAKMKMLPLQPGDVPDTHADVQALINDTGFDGQHRLKKVFPSSLIGTWVTTTTKCEEKMKKVLVTGGAGYIGSVLVRLLLEQDYHVVVVDNLSFGGESIVELLNNPSFTFVKGDIRDEDLMHDVLSGVDYVAHLAAIVGDPACAKEPELTRSINLDGSKKLYEIAAKGVKRFVFASTCSNYGKMDDAAGFVNEESTLAPVSLYAETKVEFEQFLLGHQESGSTCVPTCLRFSTVYGLSPRLRFDLTVNEFTKELAMDRELVIFGEQFWRPYCHVVDLSRSVVEVLNADQEKVAFEVFNVGSTSENYQKKMIVEEIQKRLPDAQIKYVEKQEDPRDYRVNFDKITKVLGFKISKTVPEGIDQILQVVKDGFIVDPDDGRYKNI